MPFGTINILEGKSKEYIKKVSDRINEAVIETYRSCNADLFL
jgi:hypothetical protein